jgi:hypothetical protein
VSPWSCYNQIQFVGYALWRNRFDPADLLLHYGQGCGVNSIVQGNSEPEYPQEPERITGETVCPNHPNNASLQVCKTIGGIDD